MLRSSLVSEGSNPITQHYRLVRLVGGAGQEMIWKIYEAFRISDGKVRFTSTLKSTIDSFPHTLYILWRATACLLVQFWLRLLRSQGLSTDVVLPV